jgi:arylsulfatase A-like enzyme
MSYGPAAKKLLICLPLSLLLLGALALAGDAGRPNLLLITLDTTRADYLSSYGFALPTTPHLDRLAEKGVRFSDAFSQIPLTGPSHATIMTGLYPHQHGAIRNGVPLLEGIPTLAEALAARGYRTAAFVSGWTLRGNLSGLDRGFDTYDDQMEDRYRLVNSQRFAHQVTPPAMEWLQENGRRPFFLWIHYFDPHAPYKKRHRAYDALEAASPGGLERLPERNRNYASEIRYTDAWIGKLLDLLAALDLESRTLVVATADHGEALGEHGYVGHGRRVYEEILQVPLILHWPEHLPEGRTVDTPVGLVDLAPTLTQLMDLPPLGEGADLAPLLGSGDPGKRYTMRRIFFETYPGARKKFWKLFSPPLKVIPSLAGFREGSLKFIYNTAKKRSQVFDLSADGGELHDLMARFPAYEGSGIQLVEWIEDSSRANGESAASDEDLERLRSLGYVD